MSWNEWAEHGWSIRGVYIPDIEGDFVREVFTDNFGDHSVEFMLGAFPDQLQATIMSVMLLKGGGHIEDPADAYDLRFGIRMKSLDHTWKVSSINYAQGTVARLAPRQHRALVRSLLLEAVGLLARQVRPLVVTMSTYDVELPPKALVKYQLIEKVLHLAGYETVSACADADGRQRWHFRIQA